jgi:preprotein translocase subunit SecG
LKKEIWILLIIFLFLTLLFHNKEFIEYPLNQIENLPNSSVYGLGYWHPLIFTLFVYMIFLVPRLVFKLFKRKNDEESI